MNFCQSRKDSLFLRFHGKAKSRTMLTLLSQVCHLDRYRSIHFRPHNDWLGETLSFIKSALCELMGLTRDMHAPAPSVVIMQITQGSL